MRTRHGKGIDNSLSIAGARSKAIGGDYSLSGESNLSVNGNFQVGSFEKRFKSAFGMYCEICYESHRGSLTNTKTDYNKLTL